LNQASNGTGRLMLVQTEFEVHAHHGEVFTSSRECQVERTLFGTSWLFEQAEDRFWIAKDVGRTHETTHRTAHAGDCRFGTDGRRSPFRIGKLVPCSNGAEWNVVSDDHANGRLDLRHAGPEHRSVNCRRSDRSMHYMIDLVVLQRKDFRQTAADFIQTQHCQ
jgi:hypothetical protein